MTNPNPDTRRTPRPSLRDQFDAVLKSTLSRHGHPHGLAGFEISISDAGQVRVETTRSETKQIDWLTLAVIGVTLSDAVAGVLAKR